MNKRSPLAVVILAAGKGTRMKSACPKVMHAIAGRPMIGWVLETVEALEPDKIIVVTAPEQDVIAQAVAPHSCVYQEQQLGTAHAVKAARDALSDFTGRVLVVYGDGPLYTDRTLRHFLGNLDQAGVPLGFLGMEPADPTGYGRLLIEDGYVARIVEEKDASEAQKAVRTCWTGVMAAQAPALWNWLDRIDNNNAKGEYYLTKLPEIAAADGAKTLTVMAPVDETLGANTRAELAILEGKIQHRLRGAAMENGATLIDPASVYFSHDTKLGQDVLVEPNVFFGLGVEVADNVTIHGFSHLEGVTIETGASIGPFARIRPISHIGENASVGNFIEVNRSVLKAGAKSKHVSYLGDAVIGAKSNIGAGTIIANYDGFNKLETTIGAGVFVGSNATIVAPRTIGDGALIGAGSVVIEDVPDDAIYIERSEPDIYKEAAKDYRARKRKQ